MCTFYSAQLIDACCSRITKFELYLSAPPNTITAVRQTKRWRETAMLTTGTTGKEERARAKSNSPSFTSYFHLRESGFNVAPRGACASLAPAKPDQALRKLFLVACMGNALLVLLCRAQRRMHHYPVATSAEKLLGPPLALHRDASARKMYRRRM